MRYDKILIVLFILILFSCSREKTYTYKQLQNFSNPLYPYGVYFWDEFNELEPKYVLSPQESIILGSWGGLQKDSAAVYHFFPNKLFYADFREHRYLGEPIRFLDALIGIWYVEDNVLTIKVIAINIYENGYKYIPVTPYISHLINIEDIDPIGYTKKPMAIAAIPKDIKKQLDPKTMRYKPVRMVRSLYSIRPLNSKGNNISYGYFKYVRQMAKENLSGEQIANSPELVHRFFDAPPF